MKYLFVANQKPLQGYTEFYFVKPKGMNTLAYQMNTLEVNNYALLAAQLN